MAHVHSTGSAHVHSAHGPRLVGPASACTAFSDEVRALAVGSGPASGWRGERTLGSTVHGEKVARGVLGAPLTVEEFATAEAAGQRRWRARTVTRCSDSNVVGFGHRRRRGRDGRTRSEARRGDGAARTTERRCRNGAVGRCLYGTAWARGSHAATARRQAGPARQTAADRWAPHVSDF
jgi:hypothetical protein